MLETRPLPLSGAVSNSREPGSRADTRSRAPQCHVVSAPGVLLVERMPADREGIRDGFVGASPQYGARNVFNEHRELLEV